MGAIALGRDNPAGSYGETEQQLAHELSRHAVQALDQAYLYRAAQAALRTRDEFISVTAHELKTPLTTLLGSTELLQRCAPHTQPYTLTACDQRMLQVINEQSHRLQWQIDTLLDLSQIQAGRLSLQRNPMDLSTLVVRVVDDIQPTLEQHEATVSGADVPLWIEGDSFRLE